MDEIKVGDAFEIGAEVVEVDSDDLNYTYRVKINPDDKCAWVSAATLLAGRRVARPLAVGDRVTDGDHNPDHAIKGTILAIKDLRAWVEWPDEFKTEFLSMLERAPAPDTKEGT